MALEEPSDFATTSWMPACSSTARTPPPAITPEPGGAGLSITRAAPNCAITGCGIVLPFIGTCTSRFLAIVAPLRMASGTSFALPIAAPTRPRPSPTTTIAEKLKRRPPLTTLATRLMFTTRSDRSESRSRSRPRPSRSRETMRSPAFLEIQPCLARGLGQSFDSPVILVTAAVEHYPLNTGCLRPLTDQRTDLRGKLALLAGGIAQVLVERGRGHQRLAGGVVDYLGVDVLQA